MSEAGAAILWTRGPVLRSRFRTEDMTRSKFDASPRGGFQIRHDRWTSGLPQSCDVEVNFLIFVFVFWDLDQRGQ